MNLTCPCCHAKYSLDAALEGEAAGELLVLIAQAGPLGRPLVAYLSLFRSKARALSYDRAARLAREVLEMSVEPGLLVCALGKTVESLRAKRDSGNVKPLKDHRYLASVIESTRLEGGATPNVAVATQDVAPAPRSKRAQGMAALEDWSRG